MDNTTDTLKIRINQSMMALPKENREAIESVDWRKIILSMSEKYNQDQLDILETETELLLCGILEPEKYLEALEIGMKISSKDADLLVADLDNLIFKKIQDVLVKKLEKSQTIIFDPRFSTLPKNIQEAIAKSNWQNKLNEIGSDKKLSIDKMALFEGITVQVLAGKILPTMYEKELANALPEIKGDPLREMVSEVNEKIMGAIRELEKKQTSDNSNETKDGDDEVPTPPYIISKVEVPKIVAPVVVKPIEQTTKTESVIYKNAGIEMMTDEPEKNDVMKNIINSKLSAPTVSKPVASDQSIPKIKTPPVHNASLTQSAPPSEKPHDPYHEAV